MKKIAAGNQDRVATTTGCVLNQRHREGERHERLWRCTVMGKASDKVSRTRRRDTYRGLERDRENIYGLKFKLLKMHQVALILITARKRCLQ